MERKDQLLKKWEDKKKALFTYYKAKGKRYALLIKSIRNLPDSSRDKLLNDYYSAAKMKYLNALCKWIHKKMVLKKQDSKLDLGEVVKKADAVKPSSPVNKNYQGNEKKQAPPKKPPVDDNANPPQFNFTPNNEELAQMILKAANATNI